MRVDVIKEGVRQRRPSLIAKTRTDKGSQPGRTRKKVLREHQHLVLMCMVEQICSEVRETEVGKDVKADGAGHHHTGQTIGLTSRLKSWHSSYAIIHTRLMCRCEEAAALQVQVEDATLRCDVIYVATLELFEGRMDAIVRRGEIDTHVSRTCLPVDVATLLSIRDGRPRP